MKVRVSFQSALTCVVAIWVINVTPALASAHLRPPALDQARIDQRLGTQVSPELVFRDANGATLRLGYVFQDRPAVLVLGYFRCANLCGVVRVGVAQAVAGTGLQAGRDFNVIVASINPQESVADARNAQTADETALPQGQVARWRYLTGDERAVTALAGAAGFGYIFDSRNGQYAHAAGIVLLTPQGRMAQYLFGVHFSPRTLRLGLVQASQGAIGSFTDRLLLLCCDYDSSTGRYSLLIGRVLQMLCIVTLLVLGCLIGRLRRADARHHTD